MPFGWCNDGYHSQCIKQYRRFWFEKRKRKEVVVYGDEPVVCNCRCHNPNSTAKKTTRRRKR